MIVFGSAEMRTGTGHTLSVLMVSNNREQIVDLFEAFSDIGAISDQQAAEFAMFVRRLTPMANAEASEERPIEL